MNAGKAGGYMLFLHLSAFLTCSAENFEDRFWIFLYLPLSFTTLTKGIDFAQLQKIITAGNAGKEHMISMLLP